jgi:uncharacterized protein (TIGR00369 family)
MAGSTPFLKSNCALESTSNVLGYGRITDRGLQRRRCRRRRAAADLMPTTPYMKWPGIVFDRYEPDDVTIRLPLRADLTNDDTYYHGGVIAAVLDTSGAAASWSNRDFEKGAGASTISVTVNYVGQALRSHLPCDHRAAAQGEPSNPAPDTDIPRSRPAGRVHGRRR